MKIKRLFIGDFGILRNQILDNIHPGIVVVGGKNRAGKSTFMNVLSHLGSGFKKTRGLPPATSKYLVEADIIPAGDEEKCTLRIEGRSVPTLTSPPGKSYTIDELFPNELSYKHLYTISLDELMKKPEGLGGKEISQLQSVILGGGYNDIAEIIELEKELTKEADDVGGKRGSAGYKTFKPFIEKIKQGLDEKEQALSQLDQYNDVSIEIKRLNAQKHESEKSEEILKAELDILEALSNIYNDISTLKEKESLLQEHDAKNIPEDFPYDKLVLVEDNYSRYKQIAQLRDGLYYSIASKPEASHDTEGTIKRIIAFSAGIQDASSKLPAVKERLTNLKQLRNRVKSSGEEINKRILGLGLHSAKAEQSRIEALPLYTITNESELLDIAQSAKEIKADKRELSAQRDKYLEEKDRLVLGQQSIKTTPMVASLRYYILAFVISAILGAVLYGLNELAGILTGGFGIVGSALYVALRNSLQKETRKKQQDITVELKHIENMLKELDPKIRELNDNNEKIVKRLDEIKQAIGCSMDYDADTTLKYYNLLIELQAAIHALNRDKQDFEKNNQSVRKDLQRIQTLLNELAGGELEVGQESMLESAAAAFDYDLDEQMELNDGAYQAIEYQMAKWYELLENATKLKSQESELLTQGDKLRELMGQQPNDITNNASIENLVADFTKMSQAKNDYIELVKEVDILKVNIKRTGATERIKNAALITGRCVDGEVSDYLLRLYDEYVSADELDEEYKNKRAKLSSLMDELTDLTKMIQSATDMKKALEENAQLEAAHKKIDEGRAGLRPLAYRYALLRTASFMCTNIKKSFLDRMSDELLRPAREMLLELTGGHYKGITPDDDFSKLDYTFTLSDGTSQESVDILSRGTREQVFLAVRLGRIKDSKPAPVIIDDSFVNFDAGHLSRAVGLLQRLSRTHQVFIMTCHPHLVSQIAQLKGESQYWQLDQGSFTISDAKGLIKHLGN